MYDLRFVSDTDNEITLNYSNGFIIARVDGATGLSNNVQTAQGYQQVGVSVSSVTIGGRYLTIRGYIFERNKAQKAALIKAFAPFTSGRLYWEDTYFIDVVVKDAPTISQNPDSTFSFRLFAPDPYFRSVEQATQIAGETTGAFSFPVNYSTDHTFGTTTDSDKITVENVGEEAAPFTAEFSGTSAIVNPCLTDDATGDFLKWNGTILVGDTLRFYQEKGRIRCSMVDGSTGEETNVIAGLDDESTLFKFPVGTSKLTLTATSGLTDIKTVFSFYPLYTGVLMNGV